MRDGGGQDQRGSSAGGEKWMASHLFCRWSPRICKQSSYAYEEERESGTVLKGFGLSSCRDGEFMERRNAGSGGVGGGPGTGFGWVCDVG